MAATRKQRHGIIAHCLLILSFTIEVVFCWNDYHQGKAGWVKLAAGFLFLGLVIMNVVELVRLARRIGGSNDADPKQR